MIKKKIKLLKLYLFKISGGVMHLDCCQRSTKCEGQCSQPSTNW